MNFGKTLTTVGIGTALIGFLQMVNGNILPSDVALGGLILAAIGCSLELFLDTNERKD